MGTAVVLLATLSHPAGQAAEGSFCQANMGSVSFAEGGRTESANRPFTSRRWFRGVREGEDSLKIIGRTVGMLPRGYDAAMTSNEDSRI